MSSRWFLWLVTALASMACVAHIINGTAFWAGVLGFLAGSNLVFALIGPLVDRLRELVSESYPEPRKDR